MNKIITIKNKNGEIRKKKLQKKNLYFTKDTENSIVKFQNTTDEVLRNKIYNEELKFAFEKLCENIVNKFKFGHIEVGIEEQQKQVLTHCFLAIPHYKSKSGAAFGYFSIVAKNYLIQWQNTNYKNELRNIDIIDCDGSEERDSRTNTILTAKEPFYFYETEQGDFLKEFITVMSKNIDKIFHMPKHIKIAKAVLKVFQNLDDIDAIHKDAVFRYVRKELGMGHLEDHQPIGRVIKVLKRDYYRPMYKNYLNTGTLGKIF